MMSQLPYPAVAVASSMVVGHTTGTHAMAPVHEALAVHSKTAGLAAVGPE